MLWVNCGKDLNFYKNIYRWDRAKNRILRHSSVTGVLRAKTSTYVCFSPVQNVAQKPRKRPRNALRYDHKIT